MYRATSFVTISIYCLMIVTPMWFEPKILAGSPFGLYSALQRAVPPQKAVFISDSGNGTVLAAEFLRLAGPRQFLAPTDFSSMGLLALAQICPPPENKGLMRPTIYWGGV